MKKSILCSLSTPKHINLITRSPMVHDMIIRMLMMQTPLLQITPETRHENDAQRR